MSTLYKYKALNDEGANTSGEIDATSKGDAVRKLLSDGLQPVSVSALNEKEVKKLTNTDALITLSAGDIVLFTEELAELLEAGLPLEQALSSMMKRTESGKLKDVASSLHRCVIEGNPMHSALSKTSKQFDPLYRNLVKAGEASGGLKTILHQHAIYLKSQMELKSKLVSAMIYPAFLCIACLGVIGIFIFYLLPQITTLLDGVAGPKPFGVRVAIQLGDTLKNHWLVIILGIVLIIFLVKIWHSSEENKVKWDKYKLEIPLYGKVITFGFYVQWLKTLANLIGNGVPLVQALELTQETVTNRHAKIHLDTLCSKVKDGYKLTRSMTVSGLFTPNMTDLVSVGENTGNLYGALNRSAEYYNKRLNVILANVIGILTPVILLSMAVLVGALSWTMIQAIYETIGNLKSK